MGTHESTERLSIHSWSKLLSAISQRPLLCFAMGFYWLWVNMAFQTPMIFPSLPLASGLVIPSQLVPLFACVLSYFAISSIFARKRIVFRSDRYIVAICVLMALASILLVLWIALAGKLEAVAEDGGLAATFYRIGVFALYIGGSATFGLTSSLLCIELQRIFGCLGSEQVLLHGSVAMLASVAIMLLVSFLPSSAQYFAFCAAPLPIAPCLLRARSGFSKQALFERGLNAQLNVPHKLLLTALFHGISLGVLFCNPAYTKGNSSMLAIAFASFAIAVVLILSCAITARLSFNNLIYRIGFPLIATGMCLISLAHDVSFLGVGIQLTGFCFLHLVLWGVCAFLIKMFDMPATWVVGTSTCLYLFGQFIGGCMSALASNFGGVAIESSLNQVISLVILIASIFLISSQNLQTGWGLANPASTVHLSDSLSSAIAQISSESGLTKRETTIFELFARGKNRAAISEELTISKETVKSHIQSIYRKTGTHSQQELISYLEKTAQRLEDS